MRKIPTAIPQAAPGPQTLPRAAYRISEICEIYHVCRRSVERAISDGRPEGHEEARRYADRGEEPAGIVRGRLGTLNPAPSVELNDGNLAHKTAAQQRHEAVDAKAREGWCRRAVAIAPTPRLSRFRGRRHFRRLRAHCLGMDRQEAADLGQDPRRSADRRAQHSSYVRRHVGRVIRKPADGRWEIRRPFCAAMCAEPHRSRRSPDIAL
jgi:hypothetical protein